MGALIENYEAFETRVEDDVFALFLQHLEQGGAEPQGSLLLIDKIPHRVTVDQISSDRNLTLYLVPWGETNPELIDSSVDIEHFGRVRRIHIRWPEAAMRKHESLPGLMKRRVLNSYIALQVMFVSKYVQLADSLLYSLYDILNIHIRQAGKEELAGRSWFTVTHTATSKFQYFFSRDRIERVVNVLTKTQVNELSPFELAVCLVTDEATDTFWELRLDDKMGFASLPFARLTSLILEPRHWLAEKHLFQESDIAAREICVCADQSLLINCPQEIVPALEELITAAKPLLADQFRLNLKPYRAFRDAVAKVAKRIHESARDTGLQSLATDIVAKTIKEIMKPGP